MLAVLFWTGVALAPIAALLLLVANSGILLRFAAVAAIGCVVLIGVSIALRGDPDSVRADLEGSVIDEVDAVREDVREDITTAARATHRAFGEKLQALNQTVESLRAELAAVRGAAPLAPPAAQPAPARVISAPPAAARAAAPSPAARVPVGPPAHPDEVEGEYAEAGYGRTRPANGYERGRPDGYERAEPAGYGRVQAGGYGQPAPQGAGAEHAEAPRGAGRPGPERGAAMIPRQRAGGRVRHTETVQVATRETVVDEGGGDASGRVYGAPGGRGRSNGRPDERAAPGGHAGHRAAEPGDPPRDDRAARAAAPPPAHTGWDRSDGATESWDDDRAPAAREDGAASRREPARPAEGDPWARNLPWAGREDAPPPARDAHQAQMGDRWASARSDERGSEVRMAERRAAMRADATGAELRVEDRWATARREESRPGRRRRDDDTNPGPGQPPVVDAAPPAPTDGWGDDWMSALRDGPTAPELSARSGAPMWSDYDAPAEADEGRRRRDEAERWR